MPRVSLDGRGQPRGVQGPPVEGVAVRIAIKRIRFRSEGSAGVLTSPA